MNTTVSIRPASDRAVSFLDDLLRDRNLTASDKFFDATNAMDKGELRQFVQAMRDRAAADADYCSRLIDALKKLPFRPKPASDKQIAVIRKSAVLKLDEQGIADIEAQIPTLTGGRDGTASALIDRLFAMKRKAVLVANLPEVPAGRYAVDGPNGTVFYVVKVKDNGKVDICVKASNNEHLVPFTVAGYTTILQQILDAGLREATIRYGKELGHCGVCGRELTDETSRAAGIGPVCAQRF